MVKVNLVPEEGVPIAVEKDIAMMSKLIEFKIDDLGIDRNIHLPEVKKATLEKVIEFCEHHLVEPLQEIEKPLRTNNIKDVVSKWYGDFVDVKIEELY
eukprot:CAMPEP_0168341356 /NCGR_PEP_ID=MMETSP0213-20121227/14633_1 /TAXON_ID=151035 /ORGANISM="Euplotes harpa, Strain FSP1.4" /LENGTH=97 /DNA_ID=CAMNT_0008347813 /DNA_START=10 /DNA_END=300 /DNA_ORIENTATION=+